MLRIGVLEMPVHSLSAHTAGISWCNTTIRQSRFVRPRNPLTFAVSKGRLSAPGVIRPAGSPEKNHRTYSSNRQSARVDNGVDATGGAGSSPAVSAVAVACAVTRTHHPCEVVCKRKNLGVSPPPPEFHWFLSFVQHSTKAYYVIQNKV